MHCQNCFREAMVHIIEIANGSDFEIHFCQMHAQQYLTWEQSPRADQEVPDALNFDWPESRTD